MFSPRTSAFCLAAVLCTAVGTARAAPGTASLEKAEKAWDDGDLEHAERAYQQALEQGGLDRAATLECWVHIAAARSVLGNRSGALAAYRMALFIDDTFTVPPEAGKKARQLADTARHQPSRLGAFHLALNVPAEAGSGEPFAVNALLEGAQSTVITRLSLRVDDKAHDKKYEYEEPARSVVHFSVPATMTTPDAMLHVQVDALDAHDNRLGAAEEQVHIRPTPVADHQEAQPFKELRATEEPVHKHRGFWSTAWPYVIGFTLVAAGGAAGAYFLLKPPDQVTIGPAQVQTH